MRRAANLRSGHTCWRMALAGWLAVAPALPAPAQVLPSGGSIAAGSASIVSVDPASTRIVQQSQKAVINWQSFSIGSGASVTFQQPDSAAITLNRVTGGGASVLNGGLFANGQVWLVNGNGILTGAGSRIDVGGLLATTSDIADGDFLAGHYAFGGTSSPAAVINRGSIKAATGGSVILSGAHVANEGLIQAKLGHVVLGGAEAFSVSFDGDNLIQYQITAPVSATPKDADGQPVKSLVSNSGTIMAQGGQVLMTGLAARNVVDNVINTTGIIQARSASVRNGEVVLDGGEGGAVTVGGTIDVSGTQSGETGGTLAVTGEKLAVADGARLDASGDSGGGRIQIGGLTGAQSVTVGKAVIAADATGSGKGGSVVIVSGGKTGLAGSISAKGVTGGGMVETSGHALSIAEGVRVDTSAQTGATGLWLLDPVDVDLDSTAAANIVASIASTNVSVTASNDITVNAPINYSSANSLDLLAGHNLTVNATVRNAGTGDILAVAGWDGTTAASSILTVPTAYGNGGGSVLIGGSSAGGGASLGSLRGKTAVAAHDLTILGVNGFAQLGYHVDAISPIDASGVISAVLTGDLHMMAGSSILRSFAQIGHGGLDVNVHQSGDISVTADGSLIIAGGLNANAYARIGNGSPASPGSGTILMTAKSNVLLTAGAGIQTSGTGDRLIVAAGGDFDNQAGNAALSVLGGGRWLLFLDGPANNTPGGLNGAPFYDRAFDFSANSYAAVTSAGNRFVYGLAPVVTVTANDAAKVYGSANPALSATITGGLAGDASAGIFTGSPSLGTTATASSSVGSYSILPSLGTLASDYNYGFQFVNGALQINPASLTASLTGSVRKIYDGTAAATLNASNYSLSGLVGSDVVTLSPGTALFNDKNAGAGKTVTVSGLVLAGPAGGNYVLASPLLSAAIGIIDTATLTAALTGTVRKTYDGTVAATLTASNTGLSGLVAGDSVTLTSTAAAYGDKNAGTGKIVTASGLALSGADSGNYRLATSSLSAAIGIVDPRSLTVALTGTVRKTYDGTAAATLTASNTSLSGLVAGDSVTLTSTAAVYGDKNAGTGKIVTASGLALSGAGSGNYGLASSAVSAAIGIIDPAGVTAFLTGTVQKTFDGTTAATLNASNYNLTGIVSGDSAALNNPVAGLYDSKTAGTGKTVTAGGLALLGADSGNYILTSSTISGVVGIITSAPIDLLGNSFTSNGVSTFSGPAPPRGAGSAPAQGASDATSATGADGDSAQSDSAAFSLGNSLGGAQSSSAVLLDGLLRQVTPSPGGPTRGVPPYGQIFSSWGNEAFWQ